MKITITQTDQRSRDPFAAAVQFDDGPRHPVTISDPFDAKTERELQWYFEQWLAFPFTDQVRAGRAAATVRTYGESLFGQLFHGDTLFEYKMGLRDGGLATLRLEIRGTPAFHALHWETVWDPQQGQPLAVNCPVIRANDNPPQLHFRPNPSPTLNVLLVVARPGGRDDVGYRTISRPLVEALENSKLPAQIDIVRPGTYAALSKHLDASSSQHGNGYYHIIHFDLHGSLLTWEQYQRLEPDQANSQLVYKGYGQPEVEPYEGLKAFLSFNGAREGESDLVLDDTIAHLLQTHQIPIAILNACQSGMQVGAQETSLGSRLMAAGVQAALAMGYSVTVSAAERLMTHLYRHLLAGEPLAQAIRRARLELYNDKQRRAAYNQQIALEDWLLPVVYQNREVTLSLLPPDEAYWQRQGARYQAPRPTYGFVGRDVDILTVENRLLAADEADGRRNVLLLQGMGGVGKTTLLRHLMQWWQTTRLVDQLFYFGYDEKAYTVAQIGDAVARQLYGKAYGAEYLPLGEAARLAKLIHKLKGENHLLVLDNLESVTGAALAIQHTLDEAEQARLREFVDKLAGGKTLVLLGSRGREEWLVGQLGKLAVYELPGLDREAASLLAERLLRRLGKPEYASHPDHQQPFQQLLKLLAGYPLALEVVLANLARQTPAALLAAFTEGVAGVDVAAEGKLWEDKTKSILRCVEYSHSNLSPDAQALLACLTPFTGVFNTNLIDQYTNNLKTQPPLAHLPYHQWAEVLQEAIDWGLLTPQQMAGRVFLRLQPILPYFLRQRLGDPAQAAARAAVETAFRAHYDDVGKALAQLITSREAQEKQLGQALINLEYENLMTALKSALNARVTFWGAYLPLSNLLDNLQDHHRGVELETTVMASQQHYLREQLVGVLGFHFIAVSDSLAARYLQLKKYDEAKGVYQQSIPLIKALEGFEEKQRGSFLASVYHQLGSVAQAQRDWQTAVSHYQNALAIKIEFGDRYSQASTYHQLGRVAEEQRDWQTAVSHYQNALAIKIEFGDRYSQAGTYHQLGRVAEEQEKWQEATELYFNAIEIYASHAGEHNLGIALGSLARVWKASGDEGIAERLAAVLGVSAAEAAALLAQAG